MRHRQFALEGFELSDFETEAIEFIRKHEPPEGYFVGFSGGKDSIVTLELVRMAGVKHEAYFSNTLIEHKEIYAFIRKYYPQVQWLRPKMTIFDGVRKKNPPTRVSRWCCDVLKKDPAKQIPLKHRLMGIRAEESSNRKARGRISEFNKQIQYKPIFAWKEWAVWEFIEKYNLPYPNLYDEGYGRVGCVICPYRKSSFLEDNGTARAYKNACRDWFENHRRDSHKQRFPQESFETWWEWYTTF